MTTKIAGYQAPATHVGTDKSVTRVRDAATNSADAAASGSNPVKITDQARQLASVEQAIQAMPVADEDRVNEISSAIDQGRYEISPERIADKLLRTEQELRGLG